MLVKFKEFEFDLIELFLYIAASEMLEIQPSISENVSYEIRYGLPCVICGVKLSVSFDHVGNIR